jgi:hypothetical protein
MQVVPQLAHKSGGQDKWPWLAKKITNNEFAIV